MQLTNCFSRSLTDSQNSLTHWLTELTDRLKPARAAINFERLHSHKVTRVAPIATTIHAWHTNNGRRKLSNWSWSSRFISLHVYQVHNSQVVVSHNMANVCNGTASWLLYSLQFTKLLNDQLMPPIIIQLLQRNCCNKMQIARAMIFTAIASSSDWYFCCFSHNFPTGALCTTTTPTTTPTTTIMIMNNVAVQQATYRREIGMGREIPERMTKTRAPPSGRHAGWKRQNN